MPICFDDSSQGIRITEQLGTLLQSSSMTLSAAREGVCNVVHTLEALRSDENFMAVWEDVRKMTEKLNLTPAQLPRKWQLPRRIDQGEIAHNFADCVAYHRGESWFAFLDVIVQLLKDFRNRAFSTSPMQKTF